MGVTFADFPMPVLGSSERVPDGFVGLNEWPATTDTARDRERLKKGVRLKEVPAVRRMRHASDRTGPVYVHKDRAIAYLASCEAEVVAAGDRCRTKLVDRETVSTPAVAEYLVDVLCDIRRILDRIALAAESIATQPTKE